jgi:hypothetical protein
LKALFGPGTGPSTADKHLERTRWLTEHRADVLVWLGLPMNEADNWRVEPIIVLDKESSTPFLASVTVPVVTYQRLKAELRRELSG